MANSFPKKILYFSGDGVTGSIAERLIAEGVEVTYCLADTGNFVAWGSQDDPELQKRLRQRHKGVLDPIRPGPLLEVLKDLKNKGDYFVFCDTNALYPIAEKLKAMGFHGMLPTKEDFSYEKDREKAKEFVKANYPVFSWGINEEFKTEKDVETFLDKNPDTFFVAKGNNENVSAIVPTTKDVRHNHKIILDALASDPGYEQEGIVLEEQIQDIIEFTPEAVSYDGVVVGVNIDIENKPVGGGNEGFQTGDSSSVSLWLGQNEVYERFLKPMEGMMLRPGEMTVWDASVFYSPSKDKYYFGEFCFDPLTEVLTRNGWMTYKDISVGNEVLSLNPETKRVKWKKITRLIVKEHHGEMVHIGGEKNAIDALVTPDHLLWIQNSKSGKMKRVKASELPKDTRWLIPRVGEWEGNNIPEVVLPSIDVFVHPEPGGRWNTTNFYRHTLPEIRFNTGDLSFLLGLWLAEGSFSGYYKGEPRGISIAQSLKNPKREVIASRLDGMGLKYSVAKNGTFEINNRRLARYFSEELGLKGTHADTKFVPSFFKELSVLFLNELVSGYMLGDGYRAKGQWVASTVSRRLVDDLQEVLHKLGFAANIKTKKTKGTSFTIDGNTYQRKHDTFVITTRERERKNFSLGKQYIRNEPYRGLVWDVTVADNETLLVRRNGKAFFSSNCPNRIGINAIFNELATMPSVSEYFRRIIEKEQLFDPQVRKFGASVRVFNLKTESKDPYPKAGDIVVSDAKRGVWFVDTMLDGEDRRIVGYDDCAYIVTGAGDTLQEAFDYAYLTEGMVSFTKGYKRPKHDVLSRHYDTSIPNRFLVIYDLFPELERHEWTWYRLGYDYDGVITEGVIPEPLDSVVVTGNTADTEEEIRAFLKKIDREDMPIEFYPRKEELDENPERIPEMVGTFKARKVKELGIKTFFEDSPTQAAIISRENLDTNVVRISIGEPNEL